MFRFALGLQQDAGECLWDVSGKACAFTDERFTVVQ